MSAASSGTGVIDLRSDTVTLPTPGMRAAMAEAEVGDDVLDRDPTTQRLEERVAELLGKERALFFPSGIMANQAALAVLAGWGGEVVAESGAHILHYEEGAAAALAGVQVRGVAAPDGQLTAELVEQALHLPSRYLVRSRAVALENTHLASGGRILPVDVTAEISTLCRERGVRLHLDGARLWHAAAEEGKGPAEWARQVDTVMVSFSKGLGAPVGSTLAGDGATMDEVWRIRRRMGGAMRQSGVLAAAALYALDHHLPQLPGDHRRARALGRQLSLLPGVEVLPTTTNVVLARWVEDVEEPVRLLGFLASHGILMMEFGVRTVRAVLHRDVGDAEMARVLDALEQWMAQAG